MSELPSAWMRQAAKRWPHQFGFANSPKPPIIVHSPGWMPLAEALFDQVEDLLADTDSTLSWTRCEDKHGALCLEFELTGDCHPATITALADRVELKSEWVCPGCGSERRTEPPSNEQRDTCHHCGGQLYTLDEVLGSRL